MDVKVRRDDDSALIRVTAAGFLNQEMREQILMLVATELHCSSYQKVFIDITGATVDPDEPMVGALTLISYLKKLKVPEQTRFAFLYRTAESYRKYFELVAKADGFNIKYFKDHDAAMAWLAPALSSGEGSGAVSPPRSPGSR
ncbi:MAG: hypothetical protein ABIL58_29015 [Pseudomonadota bacterium]